MFLFCLGEFSLNVARGIFTLALGMLLYTATDSLWAFTFAILGEFAVSVVIQGFAGSIVDKYGARWVLPITTFFNCLIVGGVLFVFPEVASHSEWLLFVAIGLYIFKPFIRNSVFVLISELASENKLEKLNGYISIALQCGQLLGMAAAGLMLEHYSPKVIIYGVLAGFTASFVCYTIVCISLAKSKKQESKQPSKGNWQEVFKFIAGNKDAWISIGVATFDYLAIAIFNLLLAPAVKHNFDNLARWLSFIDIAFAAGAIAGGIYISKIDKAKEWRLHTTLCSMLSAASLYLCYTINAPAVLTIISAVAFGFLTTASTVGWMSAQQTLFPENIKGRLAATRYISNASVAALGCFFVSFANDVSFTNAALLASVLLVLMALITSILLVKNSNLKKVDAVA